MAIADDISVAANGDIRYVGAGPTYTVIEFHRFLQDLADDAVAVTDDWLDITDETPSDRSTDNIITLNAPYNIDSVLAEYLYDGSITQAGGDTVFSGLVVVGTVEDGTELQIIQNNVMLKNFWGATPTAANALASANIIMRVMIKTRDNGLDIDARKLRVQSREFGDTYGEFSLTAGLGNSTAAIFTSADLNNIKSEATIAGYTSITNTEGLRLIDASGVPPAEEYYSEWNLGTQTINDLYERAKWIAKRALAEDENADTGNNFPVGNGTITRQGQSITIGGNTTKLTRMKFRLKKVLLPTGTLTATIYAHSGVYGTSSVGTGSALATSEALDVTKLTTSYADTEFVFNGDQQIDLTTAVNYVVAIEYSGGDATNYVDVEGNTTGTHGGNQADYNGAWTAAAAEDLWFELYTSYGIHSMSGELFRGPTHSIAYQTESGSGYTEDEVLAWGTTFAYDTEGGGGTAFIVGEKLSFSNSLAVGTLLQLTDGGTTGTMVVAIESGTGTVVDPDTITGGTSGRTAEVNGAVAGAAALGGTGILLALDDDGTTGNLYIQLLTGSAPVDTLLMTGITSLTTSVVNTTVTSRTISPVFIGTSTGSALIGSYGIGVEAADLTSSDKVFDLQNNQVIPPNNVTFTVGGLESGEDRVLVGPEVGGFLETEQLTGADNSNAAAAGTWVVKEAIPSDTPSAGTVRVYNGNTYDRVPYTSWTGSTFTLTGTLPNAGASQSFPYFSEVGGPFTLGETLTFVSPAGTAELLAFTDIGVSGTMVIRLLTGTTPTISTTMTGGTSGATATVQSAVTQVGGFISYIDADAAAATATFTSVYDVDRALFIRVRDGGAASPIKTFETTGTLGVAGGSTTAIRTTDA